MTQPQYVYTLSPEESDRSIIDAVNSVQPIVDSISNEPIEVVDEVVNVVSGVVNLVELSKKRIVKSTSSLEEEAIKHARQQVKDASQELKRQAMLTVGAFIKSNSEKYSLFDKLTIKHEDNTCEFNKVNCLKLDDGQVFTEHFDAKSAVFIINRLSQTKGIASDNRIITQDNCDVRHYYVSSHKARINGDVNYITVSYEQKKFTDTSKGEDDILCYRYNAKYSMSLQNMLREIRQAISCDWYTDVDAINCHPNIVKWICMNLDIDCDVINEYTNNRQRHIDELLALNPTATKDDIKVLFIRIMYGCGEEKSNFFDEELTQPIVHSKFSGSFRQKFKSIATELCKRYSSMYTLTQHAKDAKGRGYNYEGSCVSYICCFYENQFMLKIMNYLKTNHPDAYKSSVCTFDGCMIFMGGKKPIGDNGINTLLFEINEDFKNGGCDMIQFIKKPMSKKILETMGYNPFAPIEDLVEVIKDVGELDNDFSKTFKSKNNLALLTNMLANMGSSIDKFKESLTDCDYAADEMWTWFDKHIVIKNNLYSISDIRFKDFERLVKCLRFESFDLAIKFVFYFLNEVFIFMRSDTKRVFYKTTPTAEHPEILMSLPIETLTSLNVSYKSYDSATKRMTYKPYSIRNMMISYPYHIFDQQAYLWNQPAADDSIISLAQPFNVKVENDEIVDVCEDDLPSILFDYLINVICNGNQEHWVHLREYLANLILKPDEKTGIMLILYSQEKRLGKTTLCRLLSAIMNESNIGRVDNVKDAVGERGAYAFIDKKLLWFEETKGANDSASYASCMDRLKALITDPTYSYRSMYEGSKTARNHFEMIACTNNLIGVAEDRMTVLHVSDIHRNDHVYYDKFDEECLKPDVLSKFIMYLSKFTVHNPMKPLKTALFDTMADNNAEPIEQFVSELPNLAVESFNGESKKYGKFDYIIIGEAYSVYKKWHEENGFNVNKRLNQLKFGARVEHYNRNLHVRKIYHGGRRDIKVLTAPVGYFGVNPIDVLVVGN